jgi:hypothetical protein
MLVAINRFRDSMSLFSRRPMFGGDVETVTSRNETFLLTVTAK